jgi:hypothetical protein
VGFCRAELTPKKNNKTHPNTPLYLLPLIKKEKERGFSHKERKGMGDFIERKNQSCFPYS